MEDILELGYFMRGAILPMLTTLVIAIVISRYRFMRRNTISMGTVVASVLLGNVIAVSALLTYNHGWAIFTTPEIAPHPFCGLQPGPLQRYTLLAMVFGVLAAPSAIPAFAVAVYYSRRQFTGSEPSAK